MPTVTDPVLDDYLCAQETFDAVLGALAPAQWEHGSACAGWTVRDVVGHVVWGLDLVRHLAEGAPFTDRTGAPGAEHPGVLVADDPPHRWRTARTATVAALTGNALARPAPPRFAEARPGARLRDFLAALTLDFLAHAFDIGRPLGIPVPVDAEHLARAHAAAPGLVVRAPGAFAAELTPPPDADLLTRFLAFLGRG